MLASVRSQASNGTGKEGEQFIVQAGQSRNVSNLFGNGSTQTVPKKCSANQIRKSHKPSSTAND